jgi:hypothetical protein
MDRLVEVLTPHAHQYLSEQAIRDTVEAVVDKSGLWGALESGTLLYCDAYSRLWGLLVSSVL